MIQIYFKQNKNKYTNLAIDIEFPDSSVDNFTKLAKFNILYIYSNN